MQKVLQQQKLFYLLFNFFYWVTSVELLCYQVLHRYSFTIFVLTYYLEISLQTGLCGNGKQLQIIPLVYLDGPFCTTFPISSIFCLWSELDHWFSAIHLFPSNFQHLVFFFIIQIWINIKNNLQQSKNSTLNSKDAYFGEQH
jgi:hypothetical protein